MKKKLGELRKTISQIDSLMRANAAITGPDSLASRIQSRSESRGGINFESFASGGVVDRPTIGLFGESGKEAFVPLPDGRTIPVTIKAETGKPVSVHIGEVHVHNEADEDRFIAKITRMIQLQQLQAA